MYSPLAEPLVSQQIRERLATAGRQRMLRAARPAPHPHAPFLANVGQIVVGARGHWLRRAPHAAPCGNRTQAPPRRPFSAWPAVAGGRPCVPSCLDGGRPRCPADGVPHGGR
jgi:hypothetical protein